MPQIEKITTTEALIPYLKDLSGILHQAVNAGGAIGFITPFSLIDAKQFWTNPVKLLLKNSAATLFIIKSDHKAVGTVQLHTKMPLNQPHRCEVAKLMVHPDSRNQGHATALMTALENEARNQHKSLITLDTRTGDTAEKLYKSLGYTPAGTIPTFALNPTDNGFHSTTYMYKKI